MMKIYLSGGMHSNWQDILLKEFPDAKFIDPRTHGLTDPKDYTFWDMNAIEDCDVVFAYLEKSNPSGLGMAFEIGYGIGLGKYVIFVNEKEDRYAKILERAVDECYYDFEEALEALRKYAHS